MGGSKLEAMKLDLVGKDLVDLDDFSNDKILFFLERAKCIESMLCKPRTLTGKVLGTLFFEPSTRTRLSFEAAMKRLGGSVIGFSSAEGTSIKKGETLADTIKTIDGYVDGIVIRHPSEGSATFAAEIADVPVINAGDGAGRHPTQTLLDLYTIWKRFGGLNVKVALVGDLKYGRTVHSLARALDRFGAEIFLVSPSGLCMPDHIFKKIKAKEASLDEAAKEADVIYVTRIQRERFPDPYEYRRVAESYRITLETVRKMKRNAIIMHPLPRVGEIDPKVDSTENAYYFKQARNGVFVRMAILDTLLGGEDED